MTRHFCASVFLINPDDKKILLVKHKKFNKWVQPGGHIEDNEIPEETALREVYEETGLHVKLLGEHFPREDDYIRPLGVQKNRNLTGDLHIDFTYVAIPNSIENYKYNTNEIKDVKWFNREQLETIDVFEDIKISYDYILKNYFK